MISFRNIAVEATPDGCCALPADQTLLQKAIELKMASDLVETIAYQLAGEVESATVSELILIAARLAKLAARLHRDGVAEPT